MSTIFGDFVFKISAPVENAIKNLKKWDKTQDEVIKNTEDAAKKENEINASRKKSWESFLGSAKIYFAGFAAMVMKWSPHIRAHLTIMGLHMRMLAMDVGKTWAPAFKLATDIFGKFVKKWREWGKDDEGTITRTAHDAGNIGAGLLGAAGSVGIISKVGNFLFGPAASAGTMEASAAATSGWLTPFLGGAVVGLGGFALTKMLGGSDNQAYLAGIIGLGAYVLGGSIAIPITLAVVAAIVAQNAYDDFIEKRRQELQALAGEDGPTVHYGPVEALDDLMGRKFNGMTRDEYIEADRLRSEILENARNGITLHTKADVFAKEERTSTWKRMWEDIKGIFTKTQDEINKDTLKSLQENYNITDDEMKKINKLVEDLNNNDYKSWTKASTDIQALSSEMYEQLKIINDAEKENQIKSGEDMATNFGEGLENKKGWLSRTWDNIIDKLGFDNPVNDAKAQKWGSDMVKHFGGGIKEGASLNQRITSNVTINNTSSGDGLDSYGLANMAITLVNKQFANLKGLGTQYD